MLRFASSRLVNWTSAEYWANCRGSMCSKKRISYKKRSKTVAFRFLAGSVVVNKDKRQISAACSPIQQVEVPMPVCVCAARSHSARLAQPKCGLHSLRAGSSSWLIHTESFFLEKNRHFWFAMQTERSLYRAKAPGEHPNIQFGWAVLFSHFPNSGPLSRLKNEDFRKLQSFPNFSNQHKILRLPVYPLFPLGWQ